MSYRIAFRILAVLCVGLFLLASGRALAQADQAPSAALQSNYRLGTGDKLHISIFGQTELNGDYVVDATGNIQLPLVGQVKASGFTVREFRQSLTAKLSEGYFVNPDVNVDIVNYRPFYIMGQVNRPGEYPYVNGMSVLNAVALAGGYTARADDSEAFVRRNGESKEIQVPADETTKVMPGDIIRISERYF